MLGRTFAVTVMELGTGELEVPMPGVACLDRSWLPTPSWCQQQRSELAAPDC